MYVCYYLVITYVSCNDILVLQMTLGGFSVTKEGCKGVQRPKEQTIIINFITITNFGSRRGLKSEKVRCNLLRD